MIWSTITRWIWCSKIICIVQTLQSPISYFEQTLFAYVCFSSSWPEQDHNVFLHPLVNPQPGSIATIFLTWQLNFKLKAFHGLHLNPQVVALVTLCWRQHLQSWCINVHTPKSSRTSLLIPKHCFLALVMFFFCFVCFLLQNQKRSWEYLTSSPPVCKNLVKRSTVPSPGFPAVVRWRSFCLERPSVFRLALYLWTGTRVSQPTATKCSSNYTAC